MIVDVYNLFRSDPSYKKLAANDYMLMEYKCPIDAEVFQLKTELHFITYIVSGRKDWITPDQTVAVKEGDAIFLRKGVYTTRQYFDTDHCVLTFFISDDFIRKFVLQAESAIVPDSSEPPHQQIFQLDVTDSLRTLFFSIYQYLKMSDEIPRQLVEMKFHELLFNVVMNPSNKNLTRFFASVDHGGKTNLEDVMMKNFQYDLELEDFARLCGRSLSAFKRDFLTQYRQSPGKWLKAKRLEYATSLLLASGLNINEVCYESGFRNSSHFNKAFKEKYNLPPGQFREQKNLRQVSPAPHR